MAVVFDAASHGAEIAPGGFLTLTVAHTCTGTDRALAVFGSVGEVGGNVTSTTITATYAGVSMTDIRSGTTTAATLMSGSLTSGSYCFYLLNPASGANNIVVTISGSADAGTRISAGGISVTGAGSAVNETHAVAGSTSTTSPTLTITVPSGGLGVGGFSHGDVITGLTSGTQRFIDNQSTDTAGGCIVGGEGSSLAANSGISDWWVGIAFAFTASGGPETGWDPARNIPRGIIPPTGFLRDTYSYIEALADVFLPKPAQALTPIARRADYEADQQPRHLLDVSVTQSVDAPIPQPLPTVEWLRRRPDVEADQQPRHLVDVSETQGVPLPSPLPTVVWLRRRPDYEADQQPRHLVDTSETQGVPLPTPLPVVVWLRRRPDYEVEQQPRRLLDITVTQSVDSPTGAPVIQIEFLPRFAGQQARGLPVDVLAPAVTPDNPTGNVTQTPTFPPYPREPWQPRRLVDTSITQSVDSPPGIAAQQATTPRARWQGQQATPLAVDLLAPVTGPFGAVQQVAGYTRIVPWQPWLQARELDTSITQSVDSPPGYFRQQPAPTGAGSRAPWEQTVPGPISAADLLNPQFNPTTYARKAAAFQAWQKSPLFLFPSVDAPPLSGPYPTAPYRRPVPPTPYRLPQMLALPPTFFPDTNPDIYFGKEPGVILGAEPGGVYGREESVLVGAEEEAIYGREHG